MNKCAFIRNKNKGCPFGLPISETCKNAGSCVSNMCPLEMVPENKRERTAKANARVYIYYKTGNRCIYADNVIERLNAVNCSFGDNAAGLGAAPFTGSPLYAQTFSGVGLDGLYAFPMGWYADNNQSRNLFQGLFSLVGNVDYQLIKNANIEAKILEKLENGDKLTTEEFLDLQEKVNDCRKEFEDNRTDAGKAEEFALKERR
jgi:hypothetical protein